MSDRKKSPKTKTWLNRKDLLESVGKRMKELRSNTLSQYRTEKPTSIQLINEAIKNQKENALHNSITNDETTNDFSQDDVNSPDDAFLAYTPDDNNNDNNYEDIQMYLQGEELKYFEENDLIELLGYDTYYSLLCEIEEEILKEEHSAVYDKREFDHTSEGDYLHDSFIEDLESDQVICPSCRYILVYVVCYIMCIILHILLLV